LDTAATIFDEGIRTIELGRGDEHYKYRLGAVDAALADVNITLTSVERPR